MKRILFASLTTLLLSVAVAAAGEVKEIELTDGSVVTGEVVSMSGGVYTIRTDAMGTITVPDSKVRSIRAKGSSSASAGIGGQVRPLQERMESDPAVMEMIRGLKDDPQFQKVLEDPEMMRAVESGDIGTLMANPKFLQLMNNATVRDIQNKMAK
jgi:hypothetical protein